MSLLSPKLPHWISRRAGRGRAKDRRQGSLSPIVMILEDRQLLATVGTLISVSAASSNLTYGTAEVLTATVSTNPPSSNVPTGGTVTFNNGSATIGTASLLNGTATLSTVIGAGSYSVTASYGGASTFASSTSPTSAGNIFDVAGTGTYGFSGEGGAATAADMANPYGVAVTTGGNVFIADTFNDVVREVIGTTGQIRTIAGTAGTSGHTGDGGLATSATLYDPRGLVVDTPLNLLFIADRDNNAIREVNLTTGIITTVAGNGTYGSSGIGGPATSAELASPTAVAVNSAGTILYIADTFNNRIDAVNLSTNIITTVVGSSSPSGSPYTSTGNGGLATSATIENPEGVALDAAGNLYVSDSGNYTVREVSASSGVISTIAGTSGQSGYSGDGGSATSAKMGDPWGLAVDPAGTTLYISDQTNNAVRQVDLTTGVITTFAGTGAYGTTGNGGPATSATLSTPRSVALDAAGDVYIADTQSNEIRMVAAGEATATATVAPAALTVGVVSTTRLGGAPNPAFTVVYSGFVNGDTAASLTSQPVASTSATSTSAPATYPINVSGGSSSNYTFKYVSGTLTIVSLVSLPPGGGSVVAKVPTGQGHKKAQAIVLHLSNLANTAAAANVANYTLAALKPNGSTGKPAKLRMVQFDAATFVVNIFPKKAIPAKKRFVLTILGQPSGTLSFVLTKGGLTARQPT